MTQPGSIITDAITALSAFYIADRASAAALLSCWRRHGELAPADVTAILDHFTPVPEIVRPYVGRARVVATDVDLVRQAAAEWGDAR